ncbi:MAG: hydrogenase maturation nickel metallochaperone HypA [Solirubrobacterales bacterium]
MHEYAIAEAVIGVAVDNAGDRRVAAVDLRVGHLRQVVPSALHFAFELASQDTPAEGAELRVTSVTPVVLCQACDEQTTTDELPLACGGCGRFDVAVLAGEELQVDSIEVLNDTAPRVEQEVV